MGRDKATLPWGENTLLDHMVELLSAVCDRVQVLGRDPLPDRLPGKGPLGGILTALETTTTDDNLIVAVDLPGLTKDFLQMFHSSLLKTAAPLLACEVEDCFPLCLGVRRVLRDDIQRRMEHDELALQSWIRASGAEILNELQLAERGFDRRLFANLNTPEDWKEWGITLPPDT